MEPGLTPAASEKFRPPALGADHLPRPRLSRMLGGPGSTPITLVCAPSGFGKTSLVVHWALEAEEPVAWLNLEAADGEVPTFARHVVAALRGVREEAGEQTRHLLRKRSPVEPQAFARSLLADLEALASSLVLVLDDYSALPPGAVHDVVEEILRRLPASERVILIARHDPPLALQELLVSGRVRELRQAALAFSSDETAAFLEQQAGWTPDPEQLERLADRLDGWPTGIRLFAQGVTEPCDRERMTEQLPRGVLQAQYYLCAELFDRLTPAHQRRLLECSILKEFTSELCTAVMDSGPEEPELRGFPANERTFCAPLEDRRHWYRIRPLFRDFLDQRCAEHIDEGAVLTMHDHAARWLSQHGYVGEAIEHALRGHDARTAAGILADHRMRLIDEGRTDELFENMRRLPEEVIDAHLDTRLLRVWATPSELLREAIARVEESLGDEDVPDDKADAVRGELRLIQAGNFMSLTLDDPTGLPQLVEYAREALDLLPVRFRGARATAYHLLAQSLQFSGRLDAADETLDRALAEHSLAGGHPLSVIHYTRCIMHFAEGDLVTARDEASQALACELTVPTDSEPIRQHVRRLLGTAHYQWNELVTAAEVLEHPEGRGGLDGAAMLAFVWQAQGKEAEASALMEEVLERSAQGASSLQFLEMRGQEAVLSLMQGRPGPALRWAAGARTENLRPLYNALGVTLMQARILIEAGEARHRQTASDLLVKAERAAAQVHQHSRRLQILALQALLRGAEGDEAGAFAALSKSLRLASRGRFVRLYLDLGPMMRSLLARLPVPAGYEEYVSLLRAEFANERLRATERVKQELPDPLSDRELEVLELMAERLSNKEVAGRLYVSVPTVKSHALKIYQKLHVNDRRRAVEKAVALGLLPER